MITDEQITDIFKKHGCYIDENMSAMKAVREIIALAQQVKPLTDEEIEDLYFDKFSMSELKAFARAIEQAHGIGGE